MRYCPICDERYDDEIIKFCTKDGTPLVEGVPPNFTALPIDSAEERKSDFGEETVIRRKPAAGSGVFGSQDRSERIVIPTEQPYEQTVRPRTSQAYYSPPPQNTGKTIALTILGTLVVLSFGAGLFWLFQKEPPANININTNPFNVNTNLNTNLGFDSNFNFNTNSNANYGSNYNFNASFNSNLKTMTPTPRPTPIISPSPIIPSTPALSPTPRPTANTRPSVSPTPRTGPRPPGVTTNRPPGNGN